MDYETFEARREIKSGDEILVGDSDTKQIVGRGYVASIPGERAYRYNGRNPIREPKNTSVAWRHEVPVSWDPDFKPFDYEDGAPRITVMHFDPSWLIGKGKDGIDITIAQKSLPGEKPPLDESPHLRRTHASVRNIEKLHSTLSNRFCKWIKKRFSVDATREHDCVDVTFTLDGTTHLAELKICYAENSKAKIREALGQLSEYNHYPPRSAAQAWWLVLDQQPRVADRRFIAALRESYNLPLRIAWAVPAGFDSFPKWPAG